MRCCNSGCRGTLKTVRTIDAGPGKTVRERWCANCGARHTSTEMVVGRQENYGDGAHAVARRLREQDLAVETDAGGSEVA